MRNLYFLLLFSFLGTFTSLAQKIDYDHSSKWFLGFNVGATWSTTDVKSTTSSGWGVILGKSFNYNYGSALSFDLRGRYLRGNWYGQDKDTTSLANYTGTALTGYKNGLGYTVNNFQADVHRLALELAIHLNSVREKTGFDPYIFGGVGLTFKQTYGDLYYKGDSTYLYDYSSMLNNGPLSPQLSANMDGIYDTPLDGSSNKYKAYFMPSLGIGLGYQLGKRVSIGIEHKTTFTLKDDFDGYISSMPRARNDWYHYTSAYIQFRFRTRGDGSTNSDGNNNSSGNLNNFNSNCVSPTITINSTVNNTVVYAVYRLNLTVKEVAGSNKIQLVDANNQPVLFNYDMTTKQLVADINLKQGANSFTVKAENDCGKDTKTFTITYAPCLAPTASFTNPASPNMTVKNNNFTINAMLGNVTAGAKVDITQNNNIVQGFNFNPSTGILMSSLNLQPGINTITLGVSTECGNVNISTTIIYDNCQNPVVQLVSPSATGTTSSSNTLTVIANVKNVNNANELRLFQNNVEARNFTFVNGQLQYIANLTRGTNTFLISATTTCGTATQTFDVNYQDCTAPTITISAPQNNATVTTGTASLKAKVENVTSKQNISVKLNGVDVPSFTFNTTTKSTESSIALQAGMNVITVSASNNCGSDIETIYLNYNNCTTPVISVNNIPASVNAAGFLLTAQIQNMPDAQGLQLSQNGTPINYNFVNGTLTSTVNLAPGNNTFTISASRPCGNAIKNITIFYNDCVPPTVQIQNPSTTGTSTNVSAFVFKALATNIKTNTGIVVSQNGTNIPYVFNDGQIEATTVLVEGLNTFKVSVANGCGTDSKTSAITYVNCLPPVVTLVNPITTTATVNTSQITVKASILNAGTNGVSVKLNGNTVNYTFVGGVLNAGLTLVPGNNTIVLSANNNCGSDIETISIFYDNCVTPQIQFTTANNQTLSSGTLVLNATITGTLTSQNIALTVNGQNKGFTWLNGALSANLNLTEGLNTIVLSATNSCGSAVGTLTETVVSCVPPVITLTNPTTSGTTVSTANYAFSANVQNAVASGIVLKLNGTAVAATYNNGVVQANVTLQNGLNTFVLTATNACGNDAETVTVNYNNCVPPVVTLTNPTTSGTTVNSATYAFSANVQNAVASGIVLKLNGTAVAATYNNGVVQANVTLQAGLNTFVLTVTNACGNDAETVTVNYNNCVPPVVTLTNPTTSGTTVNSATYSFSANVQNAVASGIVLKLNGTAVAATYNNGVVQANVTLQAGLNTFVLTATNDCGNDAETVTVNYNNCVPPVVTFQNPMNNNSTVTRPAFNLSARVTNVTSLGGVAVTLNGNPVEGISFINGVVQANLNLQQGTNTIAVSGTNACGTDSEVITIIYDNCVPPRVAFSQPSSSGQSVSIPAYTWTVNVQHITNAQAAQSIVVLFNNVPTNNFMFDNGQLTFSTNLVSGLNTLKVTATSPCGTATETSSVSYISCVPPTVSIDPPYSRSPSNSTYFLSASVTNVTSSQNISVTQNGQAVNNFSFTNNKVQATLNMQNGPNVIRVTAFNDCGSAYHDTTITYGNCTPTIQFDNSLASGTITTAQTLAMSVSIGNYDSNTQISVVINGNNVNGYTNNNGQLSGTINLPEGLTTIVVSATNSCGTSTEEFQITRCKPATFGYISPAANNTTVTTQTIPLRFNVFNTDNTSSITITQGGQPVNGFNMSGNEVAGYVTLNPGLNTFTVSVSTICNQFAENINITYTPSTGTDGPPDRGGDGTAPNRGDDTTRNNTYRNQNVVRPGNNIQIHNNGNGNHNNSNGNSNNSGGGNSNNNGNSNNGGGNSNNGNSNHGGNSGGSQSHPQQNNATTPTKTENNNGGGSTPKPATGNSQPRNNTTPTPPSINKPNVTPKNTGNSGGQEKTNTNKGNENPKPEVKPRTIGSGGGGN